MIDGTEDDTDIGGDSSVDSNDGTCDGDGVEKVHGRCEIRGRNVDRGGGRRPSHNDNGGGKYALVRGDKSRAGTSRGDDGRDCGGGCSGHDASGDGDPSDRSPGSGGSGGCGIDSCIRGGGAAAGGRNDAPSQSELGPSAGPVPAAGSGPTGPMSIWAWSVSRAAEPSSAGSTQVEPASLESVSSRPASGWAGSGPPTSSSVGSMSVWPVSAIPIATVLASVVSGSRSDGLVMLGTGSRRIHEELPDTGQGRPGPAESTSFAQSGMSNADLLAGMVLCMLAISGAAFGYYLTVSVVLLLLLFNNTFFACFNSRTVKRWFTKKGGRLKPDKTAKEGEDPFKVSGREILANMDKNTKQALQKAKRGLSKTVSLPGAVSYIAVASLALVVVSRNGCTYSGQADNPWEGGISDPRKLCSCCSGGNCFGGSCRNGGCGSSGDAYRFKSGDFDRLGSGDGVGLGGGARPGKGNWALLRLGGCDGLGIRVLGSGSGDGLGLGCGEGLRLGGGNGLGGDSVDGLKSRQLSSGGDLLRSVGGDGPRGGGGNGLGPGSGGRLRLDGNDRLDGDQIGYGIDNVGCDGSGSLGCKSSDQLGLESDNQIRCDGLNWAGDGTKDGGGRLGAGGGRYSVNDRGSEGGRTKADREAAKGVGSRADQGEESWSALLARIVFDKDNPAGRSNTLHSVVLLRE